MCEHVNMCEQELIMIGSKKTGNEFCAQKKRKCLPNKDAFTCECKDDEFWNSQTLECTIVNDCLFKTCGLNEHCRMRNGEPKCECKETYKRKDGGVCLKDLCSDPKKKCKNNQRCLHVEDDVNPVCYCPMGFYNDNDGKCVDNRNLPLQGNDRRYGSEINPFVLQQHNCTHDYIIHDDGQITCTCLPGYQEFEKGKCRETFSLSSCDCNDNEICVKRLNDGGKETFECVCKAGELYFSLIFNLHLNGHG